MDISTYFSSIVGVPIIFYNYTANSGEMFIPAGTYYPTTDLIVQPNSYIRGETRDNVIIDFGGQPYSLQIQGTNIYTDGTISANNGDTAVVGVGTAWTTDMAGQTIFLGDSYYTILSVTDATDLVLSSPFTPASEADLSGASYSISDTIGNVKIENITVQNSSTVGITLSNAIQNYILNSNVYDCGTGIQSSWANSNVISDCNSEDNGVNVDMENSWGWTLYDSSISGASTSGCVFNNSGSAVFYDNYVEGSGTTGFSLTNCQDINISLSEIIQNTSSALQLVSGNSDIEIGQNTFAGNLSDAITVTASSDRTIINSNSIRTSIGAALTVADSTSNNTLFIGNTLFSNGSTVSDSGTGTLIRSNIGISDN